VTDADTPDVVAIPLAELGMFGQSLDGMRAWCLCALCNEPVGQGRHAGFGIEHARSDLARHLQEAHNAEPNT
jgi:hypothetical protein